MTVKAIYETGVFKPREPIHLQEPTEVEVVIPTAFAYFKRHQDQTYSFVDCLSFVVMEKLGIDEAPAVDSDFTHRFTARPGPLRR